MRRVTTLASLVTGAVFYLSATQAFAEVAADLQNGEKIFKEGKGSVPACTTCHGADGMGDDSLGTPRLAGQIPQFLVKQLEDFAAEPPRREDTTMFIMNTNARGLSAQDRRDVAAYLYTLGHDREVSAAAASDVDELLANGIIQEAGEAHLGKAIVLYGDISRNISGCRSCHGYNGRGVDPIYPKIGQQKYVYLVNQLKKWREGSRTNDPMEQMQKVARNLTDEDIRNLATYLTSASPYSMGNTRLPEQHPFMTFDIH